MLLESCIVTSVCVAGAVAPAGGTPATGTPFAIFSSGVVGFAEMLASRFAPPVLYDDVRPHPPPRQALIPLHVSTSSRSCSASMTWNHILKDGETSCNKYFATVITLVCGHI